MFSLLHSMRWKTTRTCLAFRGLSSSFDASQTQLAATGYSQQKENKSATIVTGVLEIQALSNRSNCSMHTSKTSTTGMSNAKEKRLNINAPSH